MGSRGPTPKPAWNKWLEGNPGKRPIKEGVKADPKLPSCPSWLSEGAKAEWARVAPELERLGILTQLDRAVFAAYCQSYSDWVAYETLLAQSGHCYVAPNGRLRERPELALLERAQKAMLTFARELGLAPVSRARLSLPPPGDDDEFDTWLLD